MNDGEALGQEEQDQFADMRNSKPWLGLIEESEKYFAGYQDKCDNIDKQYADLKKMGDIVGEREMKIFWANLEVLKPAIYSRPPVPVVAARFKGKSQKKELIRHSSEILERALVTSFDQEDINETMIGLRDDLALASRGATWLRLEDDDTGVQKVCYDHLDRKDFLHDPCRKWKECGWVARGTWNTYEEMRVRFEETSEGAFTNAAFEERKEDGEDYTGDKKARVWELWHKAKGVVVWISPGVEEVLDIREPFLELNGFFPCPRPVYGTVERGTLKPVPDFVYYKDQVEEINELTARISSLSESLRMKGFYAGGNEDLGGAIEKAVKSLDNNAILIPVSNFSALGGAGLKDAIVWLPVAEIAGVIASLIELRKQLIEDVYQITGISDIMRGSTNANETLGAQQLKSQYGSIRVRDRQAGLVRIARDMTQIAAEIMAENFSPETMMAMSQYDEVPTQQQVQEQVQQQIAQIDQQIQQAMQDPELMEQAQQNPEAAQKILQQADQKKQQIQQQMGQKVTLESVLQFLSSEKTRPFALEIETDSTIQPDEDAQKQRTTEFLGALSTALGQLGPMVQAQPQSADFAAEVLKFAVAPFRAGRSLEQGIESFAEQMKQIASQPKEDPGAKQAEAEMQAQQMEMQIKQMDAQARMTEAQAKTQEIATKARSESEKAGLDMRKTEAEIQKIYAEISRIVEQSKPIEVNQ